MNIIVERPTVALPLCAEDGRLSCAITSPLCANLMSYHSDFTVLLRPQQLYRSVHCKHQDFHHRLYRLVVTATDFTVSCLPTQKSSHRLYRLCLSLEALPLRTYSSQSVYCFLHKLYCVVLLQSMVHHNSFTALCDCKQKVSSF